MVHLQLVRRVERQPVIEKVVMGSTAPRSRPKRSRHMGRFRLHGPARDGLSPCILSSAASGSGARLALPCGIRDERIGRAGGRAGRRSRSRTPSGIRSAAPLSLSHPRLDARLQVEAEVVDAVRVGDREGGHQNGLSSSSGDLRPILGASGNSQTAAGAMLIDRATRRAASSVQGVSA